jgi:hypothetical protein
MNERIFDLAKQAGMRFGLSPAEQKFAELIVQECADIIQRESDKAIRNNTYMGDDVPASVTQWAIKKHFGVE